jgi:O-acetyl-ADP-ribose deacetylase (regulator of RNase III)
MKNDNLNSVGFIYGNLLDFPYGINAIAHSCNTLNVMGAGIAKQIADRYPEAKYADDSASKADLNKLGEFSFADIEINDEDSFPFQQFGIKKRNGTIYNLYTQSKIGSGREVNYEALYSSFVLLKKSLNNTQKTILGLPYGISCGLAGGSWKIVNSMINDVFSCKSVKFKTYIVKLS